MLQQPYFPPLQHFGENSHYVGATNNLHPPSPAPEPHPNGRASIDLDEEDGVEASRSVKKRYWSHDEEVRLVITQHNSYSYDNLSSTDDLFINFNCADKCLAESF